MSSSEKSNSEQLRPFESPSWLHNGVGLAAEAAGLVVGTVYAARGHSGRGELNIEAMSFPHYTCQVSVINPCACTEGYCSLCVCVCVCVCILPVVFLCNRAVDM